MKRRLFFLTLISIMVSVLQLNATTIGSNTAVTLISTMTTLNNGDIVTGFTSLQGGFLIVDSTVTATWNALFPASGPILFNGGALYLQRDLDFASDTSLSLPGAIVGNGYTMDIAPTITKFADGCVPVLKTTQNTVVMPPDSGIGTGSAFGCVEWSYDDRFVAVTGNPSAGSTRVETYFFDGTNTILTGSSILDYHGCVAWHPSAYYLAAGGGSAGSGLGIFKVDSAGALTLASSYPSGIVATCFSVGWHPTGAFIVAAIVVSGYGLLMFPVDSAGVLGTPIPASPNFVQPTYSIDWTTSGSFVACASGNGNTTKIRVYALDTSGSPALIQKASLTLGGTTTTVASAVAWNPVYEDILAIGQGANPAGDRLRLYRFDSVANTLTLITSISGLSSNINTLKWSNDGTCLMVGSAAASPLTVYLFNVTTTTLRLVANSAFTAVSVGAPAAYSPVNNYVAQFYRPTSTTGQLRISVPTNVTTFSDVSMVMNNDLSLHYYNLALNGDCSILGNGYTLSLQGTSTLAIAANSTLTLRNLNLTGLMPQAIQMADSSSKLILDNVSIVLDGNTTFTQGTLEVEGNVELVGQGAFIYSSTMPCVVDAQTTLLFDNDTTFSFVPASSARNLLQFTDSSSRLFLNGATLATTQTGIDFTKGTLVVDRHATIASDATVAAEGIAFGDGVSVTNNMNLQMYPAAVLEVTKGIVVDNNV